MDRVNAPAQRIEDLQALQVHDNIDPPALRPGTRGVHPQQQGRAAVLALVPVRSGPVALRSTSLRAMLNRRVRQADDLNALHRRGGLRDRLALPGPDQVKVDWAKAGIKAG